MRSYGRDENGNWVEITSDSYVWLATLAQTLRLTPGESPFYADYGIPGLSSVQNQIPPDAAVSRTQSQYSPYFASLTVLKLPTFEPTYKINAVFQDGTIISNTVAS